jgi:predicted dehydrogenase
MALEAGKHVFVEKPLCIRASELDRINGIIERFGDSAPLLMVGFNRRFAPALTEVRNHFAGIPALSVSYRFAPGELPSTSWPQDMEVGGGRIIGEACHAIDACVAIHDSIPVRVYAESVDMVGGLATTDDRVFITLRHASGGISHVSYQAGGDRGGPTERIEVFGGGRTATMEGWDAIELFAAGTHRKVRGGKDKGHTRGFAAFIEAARLGAPSPTPWDHVYGTTWASLAAVESLRTGLPIDIHSPLSI